MSRPSQTHIVTGGCYCGNLSLHLTLTYPTSEFAPRACTCGFCTKNAVAYLSDPQGSMNLRVRKGGPGRFRQEPGGAAEFLFCPACAVLVGVVHEDEGRLFGAVNANVLEASLAPQLPVSPHTLPRADRLARWKSLWFSNVAIELLDF